MEPLTCREFLCALGFLKTRERASNDDDDDDEVTSDIPPADDNISERTVLRCMQLYGYRWDTAQKNLYNDTHEDPIIIADQSRFIRWYTFRYESRVYRWIQTPKSDANILREKKPVPKGAGCDYTNMNGDKMVEFHVDDCKSFSKLMNEETEYEVDLS